MKPPRQAFSDSCTRSADPKNPKIVRFEALKHAFNAAYLLPALTDYELRKLIKALEAWYNEERELVLWGNFLSAPTSRENQSLRGIFPKMLVRGSDL